jgi:hypothetical protein
MSGRQIKNENPAFQTDGLSRASRRHGSPLLLELLSGRRTKKKGPPQAMPPQPAQPQNLSEANEQLPSAKASDVLSDTDASELLPGTETNEGSPPAVTQPPVAPVQSLPRHNSSQLHDVLYGTRAQQRFLHPAMQFPTVPIEPLNDQDSSRVHNVLHSILHVRQESTPTKARPTPLRSSLSRRGSKNKQHKRVSWQV